MTGQNGPDVCDGVRCDNWMRAEGLPGVVAMAYYRELVTDAPVPAVL